jgi:hypothetical protein
MNGHESHPDTKLPRDREQLRAEIRRRLRLKAQEQAALPPDPAPRYDDVFFRGVAWLDSLSYSDDWKEQPIEPPDDTA